MFDETETAWREWIGFIFASALISFGVGGIAILVWLASVTFAWPHEQYPALCCNGDESTGDCHPVDCDSIAETQSGYDWGGFHFNPGQAHPSFDRQCHVCIYRQIAPQCVFIQPSS